MDVFLRTGLNPPEVHLRAPVPRAEDGQKRDGGEFKINHNTQCAWLAASSPTLHSHLIICSSYKVRGTW